MSEHKTMLSRVEIQRMMIAGYSEGAKIALSDGYSLHCLDGQLWEVTDPDGRLVKTLNPTKATACEKIREIIRREIPTQSVQR